MRPVITSPKSYTLRCGSSISTCTGGFGAPERIGGCVAARSVPLGGWTTATGAQARRWPTAQASPRKKISLSTGPAAVCHDGPVVDAATRPLV